MLQSMNLESLNVGRAETVQYGKTTMLSGIRKRSIGADEPLSVGRLGLQGDAIVDAEHHGGPDQAIYAYSSDDYDWWNESRGSTYTAGEFGENLSIRGMPSDMNIGDRLLIGEVVLEATGPRIPCRTLTTQVKDKSFGMAFRQAERPGVYFRVLNGGEIQQGNNITFIASDDCDVSIVELFRTYYALNPNAAVLERVLSAPIAARYRLRFEAKLQQIRQK